MKPKLELPTGYQENLHIDLQKDKKLALLVNILAVVILVPLIALGHCLVPLSAFFDGNFAQELWMLFGYVIYIVLHELVHGVFMRAFSGVRPHYGFTGMYAYAGSEVYFDRTRYIVIALAPVVIWGVVLAVLCSVTHGKWFWVFYLIEAFNISGAAGDFYVTWRFLKLPKDILIQDTGIAMTVYTKA